MPSRDGRRQSQVVEVLPVGLLRVERERVLAFLSQGGVVAPQVPVTALHSLLFLGLALTHTSLGLQTVVDTGSVSDDDGRSMPSLSLADSPDFVEFRRDSA